MKTMAEEKVRFIQEMCATKGINLKLGEHHEPVHFYSLTNKKGDIASVSDRFVTYEPRLYAPPWSDYMKNWARLEGFDEDTLANQNLIRQVSLHEAIDYLSS